MDIAENLQVPLCEASLLAHEQHAGARDVRYCCGVDILVIMPIKIGPEACPARPPRALERVHRDVLYPNEVVTFRCDFAHEGEFPTTEALLIARFELRLNCSRFHRRHWLPLGDKATCEAREQPCLLDP